MTLVACRTIEEYIGKIELCIQEVTGIDIGKEKTLNSDEFLVCIKQLKNKINQTREIQDKRNQIYLKLQSEKNNNNVNSEAIKCSEEIKKSIENLYEGLKNVDLIIARQKKSGKFDEKVILSKKKVRKDIEKIIDYIKKSEDEVVPAH